MRLPPTLVTDGAAGCIIGGVRGISRSCARLLGPGLALGAIAGAGALAAPKPLSPPTMTALPPAVTQPELDLAWTASTFHDDATQKWYEVSEVDEADGQDRVESTIRADATATPGLRVIVQDAHRYTFKVRAAEQRCGASGSDCRTTRGAFSPAVKTTAQFPPVETAPVPVPDPPAPAPAPAPALAPAPAPVVTTPAPVVTRSTTPARSTPKRTASLHLLLPKPGVRPRAHHNLALRWRKNAHATYYNVQLFRGKRKLLSAWPRGTGYTISRKHLPAATLKVVVWSGRGNMSLGRYQRTPWVVRTLKVRRASAR